MTGPIQFNPFIKDAGGANKVDELKEQQQKPQAQQLEKNAVNISMNQGEDVEGVPELDDVNMVSMNLDPDKFKK